MAPSNHNTKKRYPMNTIKYTWQDNPATLDGRDDYYPKVLDINYATEDELINDIAVGCPFIVTFISIATTFMKLTLLDQRLGMKCVSLGTLYIWSFLGLGLPAPFDSYTTLRFVLCSPQSRVIP